MRITRAPVTVEPGRLVFGQPHVGTAEWFAERADRSTLPLDRFPHYLALKESPDHYFEYLNHSWVYRGRSREQLEDRFNQFMDVATSVGDNGIANPILVVERPDGQLLVVNGNHRASAALFYGREIPAQFVTPESWVDAVIPKDTRFGSVSGRPYQGVPGLAVGRRSVRQRHSLIDGADLTGRVLDLGCNIGATTRYAAASASVAYGVDNVPRLVTAALRLSVFYDSSARFGLADLQEDWFLGYDTVLAFAVDAYVKDRAAFERTLLAAKVVYIEENQTRDGRAPESLKLFSDVELLGETPRRVWRCVP